MKKAKQKLVLTCLECGKYKVEGDSLYYLVKKTGEWKMMKPIKHKSGYQQYRIGNNLRTEGANASVVVYRHILIYLAYNGMYPAGWHIDHINRDNTDNRPENLEAKPPKENKENSTNRWDALPPAKIRAKEIQQIKELMQQGLNHSEIARRLALNRLTVRYTIKNIESGKPLKYEHYSPADKSSPFDITL
jgi:hypothetical protein